MRRLVRYGIPSMAVLAAVAGWAQSKEEKLPGEAVQQPIPFSHKVHSGIGIECLDYHPIRGEGFQAGFPKESTCMGCHMVINKVKGHFRNYTAEFLHNEQEISRSSVTAVVRAESIDTGQPERDQHLRSPEFFDVELQRIAATLAHLEAPVINLVHQNVAPARPRNGDCAYADGTNWNPGAGVGLYCYEAGTWTKL